MLKADFHIHTNHSKCSNLKPEVIVARARELGLDVIGVVDHNSNKGGLAVSEAAEGNPLVLAGEELLTEWGDLLIFPSDGKYKGSIFEICERAKSKGAFVVVPHPFDVLRNCLGEKVKNIRKFVDAIEAVNGRCALQSFNTKAMNFANSLGMPKVAGSDAHFLEEIGICQNLLDCGKDMDSVLACIRAGRVRMLQKRSKPLLRHMQTHVHKLKRVIR